MKPSRHPSARFKPQQDSKQQFLMCGRFTLKTPIESIFRQMNLFDIRPAPSQGVQVLPRYNICPSEEILVLRKGLGSPADTTRTPTVELLTMQWGFSIKNTKRIVNTRAETLLGQEKTSREEHAKRCVIVADGYYEWKQEGTHKIPYYFFHPQQKIFGMAGLWQPAKDHQENTPGSCTIITVPANERVGKIHKRMPAILDLEQTLVWLELDLRHELPQDLLAPAPNAWLQSHPVHHRVNRVGIDDPQCVKPVYYDEQRSLF